MKALLFGLIVVVGMAVVGTAQTAPDVSITADAMSRDVGTLHLSGGVDITVGGVRVTADEADFPTLPGQRAIDLRGNVQMTAGSGRQAINVKTRGSQR